MMGVTDAKLWLRAQAMLDALPAEVSAEEWARYLYLRDNSRGVHAERWRHTHGCGNLSSAHPGTLELSSRREFVSGHDPGSPSDATAIPGRLQPGSGTLAN